MNTGKKIYCIASFMLAIVTLTICLMCCYRQNAYANARDEVGSFDSASGDTDVDDASEDNNNGIWVNFGNEEGGISAPIRMLLVLTVISLAPSFMIMMTSFTRLIIVLHFVRTALGTQSSPPNQVMVGLALFLTFYIMSPVFAQINETAIRPLDAGEITVETAVERAQEPIRAFMFPQTQEKDINMFCDLAGVDYETMDDVPFYVLVPSFIISELRTAFIIGFMIYIPFIVIDMVVSSVLMSMGMMMLPPTTISMPFKVLLVVLADGWNVVIKELVRTCI